jgi:hypothetical protein
MRSATRIPLIVALAFVLGCGRGDEPAAVESLVQRLQVVEARVERVSASIDSCRTSIRKIDETLADASFHLDQVPQLVRDVDAAKATLAESASLLQRVSVKDDLLVLRGLMVADEEGNPRCLVSTTGLAIWDADGRQVGTMQYDEAGRAMSASLKGYGTRSVALYAGEDRVAIGAYDNRDSGVVGWAATVSPEGKVTAGRASR